MPKPSSRDGFALVAESWFGHQLLLAADKPAHGVGHGIRLSRIMEYRRRCSILQGDVQVTGLAWIIRRPLGHEGGHQPLLLRQHL